MSQLDRPLKRVERAKFHLDDLYAGIERFLESEPYTTTREPDPDADGGYRFRIHVKAEVPENIGLIFGDFVHNLRASLDNLVWELAVHRNRKLNFPITRERPKAPSDFAPLLRASIPPDAFEIIERVQPYHATDPSDPRLRLALLNSFWNKDKHRTTTPVLAASHLGSVWAIGGDPPPYFIINPGDVSDGKIVGWMPPGQPNMDREPDFPVLIRFHTKPLVISAALIYYYEFVREDIFGAFERLP
jgi:hypothetical protein